MPTKTFPVTTVQQRFVDVSADRTLILVVNTDVAETIYVSDEAGTNGIPIAGPGGNLEMSKALGWDTEKAWLIIGSGACIAVIVEGFGNIDVTPITPTPKKGVC